MPSTKDIKIGHTTFIDVGDGDLEVAGVVVGDQRRLKTITPFGKEVDLILDLAIRRGLARLSDMSDLDDAAPLEGWGLTRDSRGIATIRHPGPEKHFLRGDLVDAERWWVAAAERQRVKLLVVGDVALARQHAPGDNILSEVNYAARQGLLAGGMIPFAGGPALPTDVDHDRLALHGLTLTGHNDTFTLTISRPEQGLVGSVELNHGEAVRVATDLVKSLSTQPGRLTNISAIVREHTGRDFRQPN